MSRRARAAVFVALALVAATAAAAIANGYGTSVIQGYGSLRPVVVSRAAHAAGKPFGRREVAEGLVVRRVPERFVPPGALASPAEAAGLAPMAPLPAGSYLLAGQLRVPARRTRSGPSLRGDRSPVELAVSGAEALLLAGSRPAGARVDVVVTSEPGGGGRGRTYVAAKGVPLLALRPGEEGPGLERTATATLGLTRRQALRLIAAESFARRLTLLIGD